MYLNTIAKIIQQVEDLKLEWEPYHTKEQVISELNELSDCINYTSSPLLKGMLNEYVWHILHWLLPENRGISDIDAVEFLGERPIGIVHYRGFKGRLIRPFCLKIAKNQNIHNYSFVTQLNGTLTAYDIEASKRHDFQHLSDFLIYWRDLK